MKKELNVAVQAAILAGKKIKNSLGRIKSIRYKGAINIVTDVDKRSESIIIGKLKKSFPDYGILSEERPAENRGTCKWIIDPLDGTTNFAHRFPFFSVSIALEKKGQIILGVVYDPVHQELFTALKGKGSYLNNKKIAVSKVRRIEKTFLATGFSYGFKKKRQNNIDNFAKFLHASLALRRAGAATLDLCYVACGRFDGFWELDLCPWDTAAAQLIVKEAGGKVTHFDGTNFNHYSKNILASNALIHKRMVRILSGKGQRS